MCSRKENEMRRLRSCAINLALIAISVVLADSFLYLCDWAAGAYLSRIVLANHMGLLFDPGQEGQSKMHDYACSEVINSLGFRDREVSIGKSSSYRIVAIGDSFTYGWGVNLEDTWCKRLETNLRGKGLDVEVLNLGKPAAGPPEYARIADVALPLLKPDMVLIGILNGDDLQQSFSPILMALEHHPNLVQLVRYFRTRPSRARPYTPPKRNAEEMRAWCAENAKSILDGMSPAMRARYDALEPVVKEAFAGGTLNPWLIGHSTGEPDYFMNTVDMGQLRLPITMMSVYLRQIRKAAEREGAPVVALSIPEGFYVNEAAYTNAQRIGFHVVPGMRTTRVVDQAVEAACRKAGVPFVCVSEEMRRHRTDASLYLELDRHLSAAGNALYADLITDPIAARVSEALRGRK
jgi:lysophospholipase L1-like esterase